MRAPRLQIALALIAAAEACAPSPNPGAGTAITQQTHSAYFPILDGTNHALNRAAFDGPIACESCHPSAPADFRQVTCITCHEHTQNIIETIHQSVGGVTYAKDNCYTCHSTGLRMSFNHLDASRNVITSGCIACHDEGIVFAPDPPPERVMNHPPVADCGSCHNTSSWQNASSAPTDSRDPNQDVPVTAQVPTYSGTSIASLSPQTEMLPMQMNHASAQFSAAANSACSNCHVGAQTGNYYPGVFHASLDALGLPQPTACSDCHRAAAMPTGFVGMPPTAANIARHPQSPEMKHDAVAWVSGAPTPTALVDGDCSICHLPPSDQATDFWTTGTLFHAGLSAAGKSQPSSCVDCHANTRPVAALAAPAAALPPNVSFDHQDFSALGDCTTCHSKTATNWSGGTYHVANPNPTSCLPCHDGERPTSTAGWTSTTYATSPFDYGVNAQGKTHGDGQDCAACHTGSADWSGGHFAHGPNSDAQFKCDVCHLTQRPTSVVRSFNHSINGTGDCFGCHQATVRGGHYVHNTGDWDGGQTYPGDSLATGSGAGITVTAVHLNRTGSLVTGTSQIQETLQNGMVHTSVADPFDAGTATTPNYASCWNCHTHDSSNVVTAYSGGVFHDSLTAAGLPQPTAHCNDCHAQMQPTNIVQRAGSSLQSMDHSAAFTGTVNIGGHMVSRVSALDCSTCHASPGVKWSDGAFHAHIGTATPADCTMCHYPLMADATKADVTGGSGTNNYKMAHKSAQVPLQSCNTCHAGALAKASTGTAATLFATGTFHANLSAQPGACIECHAVSEPAANASTQSSWSYNVPGGSNTNRLQWLNHGAAVVAGKDCVVCHKSDAKSAGSAWNKGDLLHVAGNSPTTCQVCHGLTNGQGSVVGTGNNMPPGLVPSTHVTTASAGTGVPAGTFDQISHSDINVTSHDCNFCHTQIGMGTGATAGKEWSSAVFHTHFTGGATLTMNSGSGRCSNCHMNVKPGPSFTGQDHSAFSATSAQDCSGCHNLPGGGTLAAPDWKNASGAHASTGSTASSVLDCNSCHGQGGSSSTHLSVPAASHFGGVSNGNTCISCHVDFTAFTGPVTSVQYAHTSSSANSGGCSTCHVYSSQLYTTLTTTPPLTHPTTAGGHQFSQTYSVSGSHSGSSFTAGHTDSKLTLCGNCHKYSTTTSTANVWAFAHDPSNPGISHSKSSGGCNECH